MSTVTGMLDTFDCPNYLGELFDLSPKSNPFLAAIGGIGGSNAQWIRDQEFEISTFTRMDGSATAGGRAEGADATARGIDRSNVDNVTQIFQEAIKTSYSKQIASGRLNGLATLSSGGNAVTDEQDWQVAQCLTTIADGVEWAFIRGTFADATAATETRTTRGINAAITTNAITASAALSKSLIDQLLRQMFSNNAPFVDPVVIVNAFQKQRLSDIYGYAPEDRQIGGVNIKQIETDIATLGVMLCHNQVPGTLTVVDMSVINPVFGLHPKKGLLFREPLQKAGAYEHEQIYGEIGLQHGPEKYHGKITSLTTS